MSAELQTRPLFDISTERNISNIFWVDKYISGTIGINAVFESKRINEEDLPNFANYNTTAQSNISHDLNGHELQFINGKGFRYAQSVAPSIGESEFDFLGFGSLISNTLKKTTNGVSQVVESLFGDGSSERLKGSHSFGVGVSSDYRLYSYTSNQISALRAYHDGINGIGTISQSDGTNGVGLKANAGGVNGVGVQMFGANYSAVFNGKFLDETQASATPKFPQSNLAGEVALLATLSVGVWYYLLNGDGTATVKCKV